MNFKLKNSLLAQYLLIILCALVVIPFSILVVTLSASLPGWLGGIHTGAGENRYQNGLQLEEMWHQEAAKLGGASSAAIESRLRELKNDYPEARMFWVDGTGSLKLQLPDGGSLPSVWTPAFTARFMQERSGGDPFTVVALIGKEERQGFIVFEVPRRLLKTPGARLWEHYGVLFVTGTLLILGLFLLGSLLFFNRIRRRLVRLQSAMNAPSESGIPAKVEALNADEIGRLEGSFNDMIGKLEASRRRETEEEVLRRDLIAKLSHDLRTPLTTIRSHAYGLRIEPLTARGMESVELIERRIGYLSQLIENLFSYSLLAARKYPYRPRQVDIVRMARTLFAGWYPVFEQEGFAIDIDLPEEPLVWTIDPEWLERVLDNYCQNVRRHAKSGRYIRLGVLPEHGGCIVIADRGPGMSGESAEKGAGLGLSIAALMLKEMGLRADIRSGREGTEIVIGHEQAQFGISKLFS
ncbi:HAMP domain-containing sensor histidine kinase [Paenibacillus humicola]|uniref:HAMP domain-containing sensor histidine kinase n=1 Tax=Paenibacillus humicola TaxID=3110540 RepID=UPI00237AC4D7|nr:HAMP domain-containing sensor histidine kinase [Paenibacillus humicola]